MTVGNNEGQLALIMEQMRMSMSGLCDALSRDIGRRIG
jgi:hypothetical protein